ncbi:MAG: acyl-CoA dehydrogenase family protein [Alphaproteobacteria bacterium]|jgi:alkylation response protein AidB-like acyl-CoA dehydrogenase|nr:acyl-CoA dehydrogenase [Rhodospirillaceae bacterium]MDP6404753.1 acyl-CoA dehydrogenase family protein [Alphaproteobacteria bacterium]MDP6624499.1 acyl-CoA dehydrogenase family protein [Alphaproteobacteria bacterium]
MDLEYSDKHKTLQKEVRRFIAEHGQQSPKTGGGRKRPDHQVLEWQRLLLAKGYVGRSIPPQYGGFGAEPDVLDSAIIAEEFNQTGLSPGLMNQGISMLVPTLLEVGTEEQRQRWIEPTIRGDIIWCQGYSEPNAGSDLAAAQTRAEMVDGEFIVNGQKIWTSSAHFADMMFLLARTEPDQPKHAGLSYLLLPVTTPGLEVRPLRTMTGRAEFNEVFFSDVRVPGDQIVMQRGDGWKVANVTLKYERTMIGDPGKAMNRLLRIRELMEETRVDGRRLIEWPEYRDRLLRLQGEVLAAKYHGLRLLSDQARGDDSGIGRQIVKLAGTQLGHRLSALAVDVLGAAGLNYEPRGEDVEDDNATTWHIDYMYDVGLLIGGGTSQIQKNIISERGLGMPREPKAANPATATGRGS